jgi:hypothetical protein
VRDRDKKIHSSLLVHLFVCLFPNFFPHTFSLCPALPSLQFICLPLSFSPFFSHTFLTPPLSLLPLSSSLSPSLSLPLALLPSLFLPLPLRLSLPSFLPPFLHLPPPTLLLSLPPSYSSPPYLSSNSLSLSGFAFVTFLCESDAEKAVKGTETNTRKFIYGNRYHLICVISCHMMLNSLLGVFQFYQIVFFPPNFYFLHYSMFIHYLIFFFFLFFLYRQ